MVRPIWAGCSAISTWIEPSQALNTITTLLEVDESRNAAGQDVRCLTTPWWQLRYAHTVAIRSALAENYAPATANKLLAALGNMVDRAEVIVRARAAGLRHEHST